MPATTLAMADIGLYVTGVNDRVFAMYEFNCHNFRDPMGQGDLRPLSGKDPEVQAFLWDDPKIDGLLHACKSLIYDHIRVSKSPYISLLFRDHHGKWISRGIAEILMKELDTLGYRYHLLDYAHKEF